MMIRRPGKALIIPQRTLCADRVRVEGVVDDAHARAAVQQFQPVLDGWQCDTPSAISGRVIPSARAAVQHSSRLEMECIAEQPRLQFASSPVWISTSVNRVPHGRRPCPWRPPACPAYTFFQAGSDQTALRRLRRRAQKSPYPSFGRPSISSYFVSRTRSIVPNVSRCCGPTDVINPICGCTSSTSSRISPTWRAPTSR